MTTALVGFAILLALCFFGFRVGYATLLVGLVGFATQRGWEAAFAMTGQQVIEDAMNYNLSVIPLFILMGVFIYRAEILHIQQEDGRLDHILKSSSGGCKDRRQVFHHLLSLFCDPAGYNLAGFWIDGDLARSIYQIPRPHRLRA